MLYALLLPALLLFSATTYAMELEVVTMENLNKKIYTLFCNKQITQAEKLLPSKDEDVKDFLRCSMDDHTNHHNTSYFKWILHTKKPLFDSWAIKNALQWATCQGYYEYTPILNEYIQKEQAKAITKLHLEVKYLAGIESLKIKFEQASQEFTDTKSADKYAEAKNLKAELNKAETELKYFRSIKWELPTDDSSESQTDDPDCNCLIS
jgi:hypothetical protein